MGSFLSLLLDQMKKFSRPATRDKPLLLFYVRKHGRNFGSFFDPAVTFQETRSKTEGAVATLHCSSAGLLASFHCSQGRVSVDLPAPFRCFPFFTLCCSMLYPFWCMRETEKREKRGLSAYKYSHHFHQSQHYWLSVCLLLSPIDLGYIIRDFSCHGSRKGGGTLTMLLLL